MQVDSEDSRCNNPKNEQLNNTSYENLTKTSVFGSLPAPHQDFVGFSLSPQATNPVGPENSALRSQARHPGPPPTSDDSGSNGQLQGIECPT